MKLSWLSVPESSASTHLSSERHHRLKLMSSQKSSLSLQLPSICDPTEPHPYLDLTTNHWLKLSVFVSLIIPSLNSTARRYILFIFVNPTIRKCLAHRRHINKCLLSWSKLGKILYSSAAQIGWDFIICNSHTAF